MNQEEFEVMISTVKRGQRNGKHFLKALEDQGLLFTREERSRVQLELLNRMIILLQNDATPYQLAAKVGRETNMSAAAVHAGMIRWLEQIRTEFV